MAEKVTEMLLKVDLDCYSCYKKIKNTLCKFPQIRDQIYDEKNNTVKITVVCCSPEKIRDKLCCKGGSFIKSIEILEPSKPEPKPQPPKEPTPPPKEPTEKKKVTETPKPQPPKEPTENKKVTETPKPQPQKCCGGGCLCCHGHGMLVAPPPQYYDNRGNVYGYPYGNGGAGGGGGGYYGYNNNNQRCNLDRCCDYYMSEENLSSCAIM